MRDLTLPRGWRVALLLPALAVFLAFWLLPMAALVRAARGADYAAATLPALVFYAPNDRIVVSAKARELMTRWAGPHRLIEIADSGDPLQHILAGDARSPQTTAGIAERIVYWLRSLQL